MTILIILIALLYLAGMAKASSDALADEGIKSSEWKRKYDFTKPAGREWWYFRLYKPGFPEKFPFSTTILVFLTDRWHLSQFLMLRCFYAIIAISLFSNFWMILFVVLIVCPLIAGLGFESVYHEFRKSLRNEK
jgi:hypothetical protein